MKKKIENEESYEPQNEKNWFETEWDAMRIRNARKKTRNKFYNFKKKRRINLKLKNNEEIESIRNCNSWSWKMNRKYFNYENRYEIMSSEPKLEKPSFDSELKEKKSEKSIRNSDGM